jgi:hypothetical protein
VKSTILALLAAGLILAGLSGCVSMSTHAGAADSLRTWNDGAVETIETTCRVKALAAARNPDVEPDQAEADAAGVLATCQDVRDAQHLFAAAHAAWVGYLLQSLRDDDFDPEASLALARDAASHFTPMLEIGAGLIDFPPLPPLVSQLLGGRDE